MFGKVAQGTDGPAGRRWIGMEGPMHSLQPNLQLPWMIYRLEGLSVKCSGIKKGSAETQVPKKGVSTCSEVPWDEGHW